MKSSTVFVVLILLFSIITPTWAFLSRCDWSLSSLSAKVDWRETSNFHEIAIDVLGVKQKDLKIEIEDEKILRISGERKREENEKKGAGDIWHHYERMYGTFCRQFHLPENADLESVKADLQNGVLRVVFAKLPEDKSKGRKVVHIGEKGMENFGAKNVKGKYGVKHVEL